MVTNSALLLMAGRYEGIPKYILSSHNLLFLFIYINLYRLFIELYFSIMTYSQIARIHISSVWDVALQYKAST